LLVEELVDLILAAEEVQVVIVLALVFQYPIVL
jgi:hypothetical protein